MEPLAAQFHSRQLDEELLRYEPNDANWEPIQNLDAFFLKIYSYYVGNGFVCSVLSRLTGLVNLGFTICFSTFLMIYVDWSGIMSCRSQVGSAPLPKNNSREPQNDD